MKIELGSFHGHSFTFHAALLMMLCFLLQACASTPMNALVSDARPAGCEQSLIYDHVPAPKIASGVLIIAVSELVRARPEARPYLVGAFDRLLSALEDNELTYVELATIAADQISWVNQYFGDRLLIYSALLGVFDRPIPLYPCDRDLIRKHLQKQRAALAALT